MRKLKSGLETPSTSAFIADWKETGSQTPGFQRKLELGLDLPVNQYRFAEVKFRSSVVAQCAGALANSWFGFYEPSAVMESGSYGSFGNVGPKPGSRSKMLQKLSNALFDEVVGAEIGLLPFMKEWKETVKTVTGALQGLQSIYRGLVNGHPNHIASIIMSGSPMSRIMAHQQFVGRGMTHRAASHLSNRWLEASYGIYPLTQDLQNAPKVLGDKLVPPDRLVRADARHTAEETVNGLIQIGTGSHTKRTITGKIVAHSRASVFYEVESPWLVTAQQLGLDAPFAAAYECIPFSFVLDWFTPIGSWLKSGRSIKGKTLKRGWTSVNFTMFLIHTNLNCAKGPAVGTSTTKEKWRDALPNFPSYLETDVWDPSLGIARITSALSLCWQQIAGRQR